MLFDIKSIVVYGLMTLAHASPLPELSKRAKYGDFKCPDGNILSDYDVRAATHQCQKFDDGKLGKYPASFGNMNNNQKVFNNIPDGTALREFPLLVDDVYNEGKLLKQAKTLKNKLMIAGPPGPYRIVTDYNNYGVFRGVMQHTGATVGGAYTACTRLTSTKRDTGEDNGDKEKRDNKNGDNEERSVQATETEMAEESTGHTVSDLTTRSKKKKIGSATCSDGVTLSKDDVANAFKECKKSDDYGVGGYPHKFGNMSGNSQVFDGVTKELREYPILQGATWTGGVPGQYRVVTDYSNNFLGVMIESAGASFSRCTINAD
ncbi:hypothetical protein FE257_003733 [Aspergillus nanangensis]|uniref:Uncharacterized protein n=1 Tax=Aspergillus nanangensis TaxID=2582783 RepID=A0AAD4GND9_ASPNN|nr:hypothetical protein FE257_003733 [Aspergillus nanangensis]